MICNRQGRNGWRGRKIVVAIDAHGGEVRAVHAVGAAVALANSLSKIMSDGPLEHSGAHSPDAVAGVVKVVTGVVAELANGEKTRGAGRRVGGVLDVALAAFVRALIGAAASAVDLDGDIQQAHALEELVEEVAGSAAIPRNCVAHGAEGACGRCRSARCPPDAHKGRQTRPGTFRQIDVGAEIALG